VHAISLADLALTRTLAWAADSLNPRLRIQAELERLQREISLLREESRIKDIRMEQIEPDIPSKSRWPPSPECNSRRFPCFHHANHGPGSGPKAPTNLGGPLQWPTTADRTREPSRSAVY